MFLDPHDHNPDGIIEDEKSLAIKRKVMERLKGKNRYDAVSKVAMFLGTMITTATAGVIMGSLLNGGGWAALGAALASPPILGALAVGAAIIGVAVATDYISSYIGQGANFDVQEASARSTARSMRMEFEDLAATSSLPPQLNPNAQKSWVAQAEAEKLMQAQEMAQKRG